MSFILGQMQRPSCGQWISFSLVFKLLPIFNFPTNLSQENLQLVEQRSGTPNLPLGAFFRKLSASKPKLLCSLLNILTTFPLAASYNDLNLLATGIVFLCH